MFLLADSAAVRLPPEQSVGILLASLLALGLFIYGFACLVFSLRHKQPDIPWTWAVKTGLKRANFTQRGQLLRGRWARFGLIGFLLLMGTGYYQKIMARQYAAAHKPPAASRGF